MDNFQQQLIEYFNAYSQENSNEFKSFKKHVNDMLVQHISPLATHSKTTSKDNSWRAEQKAFFKGRGMQWIFVELIDIQQTLNRLQKENFDTTKYDEHILREGKAWVRYSGPKLGFDSTPVAAFEVRLEGSTIPSKAFYYLEHDKIYDVNRLPDGKTPHQLKLEIDPQASPMKTIAKQIKEKAEVVTKKVKKEKKKVDVISEPLKKEDLPVAPASNNPDDWNQFLNENNLDAPVDTSLIDEAFSDL